MEIRVLGAGSQPLHDELVEGGYEVGGEPRQLRYSREALRVPPGPLARLRSVPGYLRRFRRWVESQSPAIVHVNTLITIPEAIAARRTGVPVLMYVHEMLPKGAGSSCGASDQVVRGHRDLEHRRMRGVLTSRKVRTEHHAYYGIERRGRRPSTETAIGRSSWARSGWYRAAAAISSSPRPSAYTSSALTSSSG